jgi:hypothetical protein
VHKEIQTWETNCSLMADFRELWAIKWEKFQILLRTFSLYNQPSLSHSIWDVDMEQKKKEWCLFQYSPITNCNKQCSQSSLYEAGRNIGLKATEASDQKV